MNFFLKDAQSSKLSNLKWGIVSIFENMRKNFEITPKKLEKSQSFQRKWNNFFF